MTEVICNSTNVNIANSNGSVSFQCPKCGKYTIVRSANARRIAAKYKCPDCEFEGP